MHLIVGKIQCPNHDTTEDSFPPVVTDGKIGVIERGPDGGRSKFFTAEVGGMIIRCAHSSCDVLGISIGPSGPCLASTSAIFCEAADQGLFYGFNK
jgi:hypothetical protein